VFKILPSKDSKFELKSLDNIPFMRASVKESMRLLPVVNGNTRRLNDNIVLNGYQVPKGTDILMVSSANRMHFEKSNEYIPERWLKENHDEKCPHARDTHPFAFLPFGFGSRMCVGRRMADMELEIMTARILREFKIEWHQPDLKRKTTILTLPDGPLKFTFKDL
jgi:cytochrome P450 family 12